MFSASFAAARDCRHFLHASFEYLLMNQKKILNAASRILGAGLFFLIVLLSTVPVYAADVTLAWDQNNESDLEGYGVYFRKDTPGPPYDLSGYVTTDEFSNPTNPTFTVTGLDKGARYYFAVTAYDTDGNESYFSNSVCADVGDVIAPCSNTDVGGGGGSSGGSGGGAGCFIEAASTDAARFNPWLVTLTALGCMVAGLIFVAKRRPRRFLPLLARNALRNRFVNRAGRHGPFFIRIDNK
jgi:hypothetical protein